MKLICKVKLAKVSASLESWRKGLRVVLMVQIIISVKNILPARVLRHISHDMFAHFSTMTAHHFASKGWRSAALRRFRSVPLGWYGTYSYRIPSKRFEMACSTICGLLCFVRIG